MSILSAVCDNANNNHSERQSETCRTHETRNCLNPVHPGWTIFETLVLNLGGMEGEIYHCG